MRQPLVAGNWKMNGTREGAATLLEDVVQGVYKGSAMNVEVLVCPPFVYLADAQRLLRESGVELGAQNVSAEESGAFTGEVAATMILDFDARYVIIGHSERRHLYSETDTVVARKFMAAIRSGLTPILCVGETLDDREGGHTTAVIESQVQAVLDAAGVEAFANAVIAYEPVWAIGTGKTATPEQAQEVHALIRAKIRGEDDKIADEIRLIYGGSVKASNAADIFAQPDIDGGLIGGASLDADSFLSICRAAG